MKNRNLCITGEISSDQFFSKVRVYRYMSNVKNEQEKEKRIEEGRVGEGTNQPRAETEICVAIKEYISIMISPKYQQ